MCVCVLGGVGVEVERERGKVVRLFVYGVLCVCVCVLRGGGVEVE